MSARIFSWQNFRVSLFVTYCIYATIGQNLVFLRGFSENRFASLINRAPPSPRLRRTRGARMAAALSWTRFGFWG
jgi:hypothetical protein